MQSFSQQLFYKTAPDGTRIRLGHWHPKYQAKGLIVILHGRTEFIEKYEETIIELQSRGYEIWTMDWRGQGLSDRELAHRQKGHIRNFEAYLLDLEWLMTKIIRHQGLKPILLAHSMGGHIAARAFFEQQTKYSGLILTSPMFDIPLRGINGNCTRLLLYLFHFAGLNEKYVPGTGDYKLDSALFEGNALTSDPKRFDAIQCKIRNDPDLAVGGPTFGWVYAAFRSIDYLHSLQSHQGGICPVLVCTALSDKVVSISAQTKLCAKHGWKQISFEGSQHEILQEVDPIRNRFWEAFDKFCYDLS